MAPKPPAKQEPLAPVPPQNLDAEESVIGAALIGSARTVEACSEILSPDDFYRESHSKIWRAILRLHAAGEPHDAITVHDELDAVGNLEAVGGRTRIHELASLVPATANAAHYARIVHETAELRGLIRVGTEISTLGWDRPGENRELFDRAEALLYELTQARETGDFVTAAAGVRGAYERLLERYESGTDLVGLPSGLADLDRVTSGFQPGNLIIVAARPSMGKSALALTIAANVAVGQGLPVALFTLEMSEPEVSTRLLAMQAHVDSQRIQNGRVSSEDWPRINAAAQRFTDAPLIIDDSAAATVLEIRSKARRAKIRYPNLALVIVDYLQLMTSGEFTENRTLDLAAISRALKALAKELAIPVLALSQLSRAVEQRHDKRPILSDIRESGALEQDADVVMFIYRDEYYHPEDTDQQGLAELNVAKHRNGPTRTVKLAFVKRWAAFGDPALPGTSTTI